MGGANEIKTITSLACGIAGGGNWEDAHAREATTTLRLSAASLDTGDNWLSGCCHVWVLPHDGEASRCIEGFAGS